MDASGNTGLSADETGALEGEDHLVDGGRSDPEVMLDVGFGRWAAEDAAIGIDKARY